MSESLKPFRIYLVEDSPRIQRILASAIEQAGAELSGCSDDAQTAISDVFVLQPDLILIDISLASGSGFDVLRALRDHSLAPGASKVVLTNYAYAEYEDLSTRLGADRFFDKSLEMTQAVVHQETGRGKAPCSGPQRSRAGFDCVAVARRRP
jgi:DNA-binding response OmpR family regulator